MTWQEQIEDARKRGEGIAHEKMDDETFEEVLAYTIRKARVTGHSMDYVPLLLVDEVKDHFYRERINAVSKSYQEMKEELSRQARERDGKYSPAHARPFFTAERKSAIRETLLMSLTTFLFYTTLFTVWWFSV